MSVITRLKLHNFRRFEEFDVAFDDKINVFIGDNEVGKSSLLLALDLVLSGSRHRIESLGLENLFNAHVVARFLKGAKDLGSLPVMHVEIYLDEQNNPDLNGKNNSEDQLCDGLRLICEPIDDFRSHIADVLSQTDANFPFEYYSIGFFTFSGEQYSGYRKFLTHLHLDSSQIGNEHATREYIKTVYRSKVDTVDVYRHQNEYRRHKNEFKAVVLDALNASLDDYSFSIRTGGKSDLEADLTITEEEIPLENRGKGRQCIIKAEFALQRKGAKNDLDIMLLEEPENHLSHINMKKLVQRITESTSRQLFVATHSAFICSRLDLRQAIMLGESVQAAAVLRRLPEETARFFMKAPDSGILEFILSRKVVLVEGDAEYLLIEAFYINLFNERIEQSDIHVISVGGTSFKRYLDLAKLLQIRTAVIRDNDGDAQVNCIMNYSEYTSDEIQIFYENDNNLTTFEICLYRCNDTVCDELFSADRRKLSVIEYMLKNKTDAAFELLEQKASELIAPSYIREALEWIRK